VLSPVLIALLMILWGTFASQFCAAARAPGGKLAGVGLNFCGMALALYVFMADSIAVAHRGLDAIRMVLAGKIQLGAVGIALLLMGMPLLQLIWRLRLQKNVLTAPA